MDVHMTKETIDAPNNWWHPSMNFFGKNAYMVGDDSNEGYFPGTNEPLEERTAREAQGAVRLAGIKPKASVLDVPCGYGRHSIFLAQRGYTVIGLDINVEHLRVANRMAEKEGVKAQFHQRDMRSIGSDLYNKFDAVFNLTLSFGFFDDEEENVQTMREFYSALKTGGKLVLHSDVSPEMITQGNYLLTENRTLPHNKSLIIKEEFDEEQKRLNGIWTLIDNDTHETQQLTPYSVRIYTAPEFEELSYRVGFKNVTVYGSFDVDKFQPGSKEIICVATK